MPEDVVPEATRPFTYLGFVKNGLSGREWFGDCTFCGGRNKLYLNTESGQWSCKRCAKEGNVYQFLEYYWEEWDEGQWDAPWTELSDDRGIPVEVLRRTELRWDGDQWILPVRNEQRTVLNYRIYRIGGKMRSLPGLPLQLWCLQRGGGASWICEGEWDGICLADYLRRESEEGSIYCVPGSGVFRDAWASEFSGKRAIVAYDNDQAGKAGANRVHSKLQGVAESVFRVAWPDSLPQGFDVRDFYTSGGTFEALQEVVVPLQGAAARNGHNSNSRVTRNGHSSSESLGGQERETTGEVESWPLLRDSNRIPWSEVLSVYRKWMYMTPDMEIALQIIFATILSTQIEGDPLWLHVVGPPGCGKTEMLMSTAGCGSVFPISTITPNTFVSGYQGPGGSDPSLIPRLQNKAAIFKDFTEVLKMNKQDKENVYSVLRGAFDGEVMKPYGNGVTRHYLGVHFSVLSGVTHHIFSEQSAIVGERFLVYHVLKGVAFDASPMIMAALLNSGVEESMRKELSEVASSFLSYRIEHEDLPILPERYLLRLVALSQLVSMLRACVERDLVRDRIAYRPQHESGTRLAKQLKKLIISLGMLRDDRQVTDAEYAVAARVALDTCIGFNLEVLYALEEGEKPGGAWEHSGGTLRELSTAVNIPEQTLRDQLEDMVMLGVLDKIKESNGVGIGRNLVRYKRSQAARWHWESAGLGEIGPEFSGRDVSSPTRVRRSRRIRRSRTDDGTEGRAESA